jgi:hypothetical protein
MSMKINKKDQSIMNEWIENHMELIDLLLHLDYNVGGI